MTTVITPEVAYWLALQRAPGIGSAATTALLNHFGSPRAVFECGGSALAACGLLTRAGANALSHPDWAAVDGDLAWLGHPGNHALTLDDARYPVLLREISDPPTVLFVTGDIAALSHPQLAIVGSRNPSPGGSDTAHAFAGALCTAGLTITSGLALGIDAAAHRGALNIGGVTIAVAGTGLDRVYPARHRELAHEITQFGALVSEFSPGTPPLPANFPRRNRIISGLSLGTLVVEAALRSGSLITARAAVEQGREVFAVPGSIQNPLARGCHALIRQGAKLVETANDVIEELGPLAHARVQLTSAATPRNESAMPDVQSQAVLRSIGFDPVTMDMVIQRSGLTAEAVSSILLMLELQGHVVSIAGGLYTQLGKRGLT